MTTDLKIQRLSAAIAEALAALVDLAKEGDSEGLVPQNDAPPATRVRTTRGSVTAASKASAPAAEDSSPQEAQPQSNDGLQDAEVAAPAEEPQAQAAEPDSLTDEPEASGATMLLAKQLTLDLVKTIDRGTAAALLEEFGVANASKLSPESIAPFCEKAREALLEVAIDLTKKLREKTDRDTVAGLLEEFDAAKASALTSEQLAPYCAAAKARIEA